MARRKDKTVEERFFCKVRKTENCWEWKGCKDRDGYGRFIYNGKIAGAHRVSMIIHGAIIPEGFLVLHKCDNPQCVNPSHLFIGTDKDNMFDKESKGRGNQPFGSRSGRSKLNELQVKEIKKLLKTKTKHSIISQLFNVTSGTISAISVGKTWKHV